MAGEQTGDLLIAAFPQPGPRVQRAFHQLWIADSGTDQEKARLGPIAALPRPWDPATCVERGLRWELWLWLDNVVAWLNSEYVWDISNDTLIPSCWPLHPHLIHEVAALADLRRRAGIATGPTLLDEWHRIHLPSFVDRMRQRLRATCERSHAYWPGRPAQTRYDNEYSKRNAAYTADQAALPNLAPAAGHDPSAFAGDQSVLPMRHLQLIEDGTLVDTETGEVADQ